jgi:hypothetical protein
MKMKRISSFLIVAALLGFFLGSCGNKEGAPGTSDSTKKANSTTSSGNSSSSSTSGSQKFAIRSGTAQGSIEAMGGKMQINVYFDDWGNKTCNETIGEVQGRKVHQISVTKDGYSWVYDLEQKMGRKMKSKGDDFDFRHMSPDSLKAKGIAEVGKESILGRECTVYSINPPAPKEQPKSMPPVSGKFWIWSGFPMKMEMGTFMKMQVTKIDEGTPPAEKFEIPADIKFTEM